MEEQQQESLLMGFPLLIPPPINILPASLQPLGEICAENTTLIGDAAAQCFGNPDRKWLVQCFPKAVLQTIFNRILSGEIIVSKRYIFLMVGSNQVFRAIKTKIHNELELIINAIVAKNQVAKIFIASILPRPAKDEYAKVYIMKMNRFLSASVKKLQRKHSRVFYVPVQLQFQKKEEYRLLYQQNMLQLSEVGVMRLKQALVAGAGFIQK